MFIGRANERTDRTGLKMSTDKDRKKLIDLRVTIAQTAILLGIGHEIPGLDAAMKATSGDPAKAIVLCTATVDKGWTTLGAKCHTKLVQVLKTKAAPTDPAVVQAGKKHYTDIADSIVAGIIANPVIDAPSAPEIK